MAPRSTWTGKKWKLTKDYWGILGSHNLSNVGWHDGDGVKIRQHREEKRQSERKSVMSSSETCSQLCNQGPNYRNINAAPAFPFHTMLSDIHNPPNKTIAWIVFLINYLIIFLLPLFSLSPSLPFCLSPLPPSLVLLSVSGLHLWIVEIWKNINI